MLISILTVVSCSVPIVEVSNPQEETTVQIQELPSQPYTVKFSEDQETVYLMRDNLVVYTLHENNYSLYFGILLGIIFMGVFILLIKIGI